MGRGTEGPPPGPHFPAADLAATAEAFLPPPPAAGDAAGVKARRHPHGARRAAILAAHPNVTDLARPYPATAAVTAGLVGFQLATAILLPRHLPAAAWLPAAYAGGAVVDFALWAALHEAAHDLVFAGSTANRLVGLLANIPLVFPASALFRHYHRLHHGALGRAERDLDMPSPAEVAWVGTSPPRKAAWLAAFAAVQVVRTAAHPTARRPPVAEWPWIALNWGVAGASMAAVAAAGGWRAVAYLAVASAAAVGLHPVGARGIAEHYPAVPFQATYSYYGPANVALNVGYHVEHHDFPAVPWVSLPALRRAAAPFYDSLWSYSSYTRLLWAFLVDRRWGLASRLQPPPVVGGGRGWAAPGGGGGEPGEPRGR